MTCWLSYLKASDCILLTYVLKPGKWLIAALQTDTALLCGVEKHSSILLVEWPAGLLKKSVLVRVCVCVHMCVCICVCAYVCVVYLCVHLEYTIRKMLEYDWSV